MECRSILGRLAEMQRMSKRTGMVGCQCQCHGVLAVPAWLLAWMLGWGSKLVLTMQPRKGGQHLPAHPLQAQSGERPRQEGMIRYAPRKIYCTAESVRSKVRASKQAAKQTW